MCETPLKSKRKACKVPQSLNFRYNYLSNGLCKTLPNDETNLSIDSKEIPMNNSKLLSSKISNNQFFHYKNSYLNEKILKFNCMKNQDSFQTLPTEYFEEKPLITLQGFQKEPYFEEEYKLALDLNEPEIKFTENTEKNLENDDFFSFNNENFISDSKLDTIIRVNEVNRNLGFEKSDFFPVNSCRNRYDKLILELFGDNLADCYKIIEGLYIKKDFF